MHLLDCLHDSLGVTALYWETVVTRARLGMSAGTGGEGGIGLDAGTMESGQEGLTGICLGGSVGTYNWSW